MCGFGGRQNTGLNSDAPWKREQKESLSPRTSEVKAGKSAASASRPRHALREALLFIQFVEPAAQRNAVPSVATCVGGGRGRHCGASKDLRAWLAAVEGSWPATVLLMASKVLPNPSFKRSANGRPPSPRAAVVDPASRGLGVLPSSPA